MKRAKDGCAEQDWEKNIGFAIGNSPQYCFLQSISTYFCAVSVSLNSLFLCISVPLQ